MNEYTLEKCAAALVSRLPLAEIREQVLKLVTDPILKKGAAASHHLLNKLDKFDIDDEKIREYLEDIINLDGTETGRLLEQMITLYDETYDDELRHLLKINIYREYLAFQSTMKIVEEDYQPPIQKRRKLIHK